MKKPRLSFWQIWNMSFGFFGIQFGFALQNSNVSRIFETLGAKIENIPILWIAAPLTGLIIQPIIGHMSDKTWCRLGRRRPYFLVGAILTTIALFLMPFSPVLWISAGMLWIMDASINISMEPFRAFVGDMLPSEQRTVGFSMQSFFIGTGAVIASSLPYILTKFGIANTAAEGIIPPSVKLSFIIGAVVLISSVVWTVFSSKEYSPEELAKFEEKATDAECERDEAVDIKKESSKAFKIALFSFFLGAFLTVILFFLKAKEEVFIFSLGLMAFGILEFIVKVLVSKNKTKNGFAEVLVDLNNMPRTMRQLAVVQFFSWFALFAMWIYTTSAVTSTKYDMKIDSQMLGFLKTEFQNIKTSTKLNQDEINSKTKDFEKYENRLTKDKTTNVSVTFVSFFINKIYNDKILLNDFKNSLANYTGTKDKKYNETVDKLNKIDITKDVDITYSEMSFVYNAYNNNQITLPDDIKPNLSKYLRLKQIREEYNNGADWVGVCFAIYNGFAAIFAFFLMFLAKKTSRKVTHAISLIVGAIGLGSIFIITNPALLLISFIGVGMVWASILAMPYAILSGSLPQKKMGTYMGIFNFFIVIPQILAASILGFFVKVVFNENAIYALMLGAVSLLIAAITVFSVEDKN